MRKPARQGSKLAAKGAYIDVSDRRLHVQLTQEAKIAPDFSLFRAIFAFAGFVSALSRLPAALGRKSEAFSCFFLSKRLKKPASKAASPSCLGKRLLQAAFARLNRRVAVKYAPVSQSVITSPLSLLFVHNVQDDAAAHHDGAKQYPENGIHAFPSFFIK